MTGLTPKQARVLEFVRERISGQRCPPTVREIAKKFRFAGEVVGIHRALKSVPARPDMPSVEENQ